MFNMRNLLRLVILLACALVAYYPLPEIWHRWGLMLPSFSPLLGMGGALAARAGALTTLLALPLLLLPLFKRRFFCWHLCPMGFVAETVGRPCPKRPGVLRRLPFIGKGLALLMLGGALVGYPLFIWMDPLSIFNGFFAAWHQPFTWLSFGGATGFILIIVLSLLVPNIWCHRLCPLGGLQEWLSLLGAKLRKPRAATSATGLSAATVGRRVFLGFAAGGVAGLGYRYFSRRAEAALIAREIAQTHPRRGQGKGRRRGEHHLRHQNTCENQRPHLTPIRPPGAVAHSFNALCARCGNCIQACPYKLIVPDLGVSGIDGLFTPVLKFRSQNPTQEEFCFQECVACTTVCPTGAIRLLNVAEKQQTSLGLAHVCKSACIAWEKQEYCVVCQEYCPYQAVLEIENQGVMCPEIDATKCRGCGACESQCPAEPIAIVIRGKIHQEYLTDPSPQLALLD